MTIIDPDPRHRCDDAVEERSMVARVLSSPWRIAAVAVALVVAVNVGGSDGGPGLCVFRRCTGGYCPGCGLTRAARHLTRGQVGAAWQDHPWLVLAVAQALVAAAVYAVARRIRAVIGWNRVSVVVGVFNVVLLLGIWIVRLVDGSIPRFY